MVNWRSTKSKQSVSQYSRATRASHVARKWPVAHTDAANQISGRLTCNTVLDNLMAAAWSRGSCDRGSGGAPPAGSHSWRLVKREITWSVTVVTEALLDSSANTRHIFTDPESLVLSQLYIYKSVYVLIQQTRNRKCKIDYRCTRKSDMICSCWVSQLLNDYERRLIISLTEKKYI